MVYKNPFDFPEEELLTPEEEVALAKRIQQGDITARNKLVNHNYRLIPEMAKRYLPSYIDKEKAREAGEDALIRAADRFNPQKYKTRFSTYACWAIINGFRTIRNKYHKKISREKNIGDEDNNYLENLVGAEDDKRLEEVDRASLRKRLLNDMKKVLSEREISILEKRYLSEKTQTLEQVGNYEGVCKERIRQIEFRALKKLQEYYKDEEILMASFS
jgi:RNA polymerase nonessential primary-like sigma factor